MLMVKFVAFLSTQRFPCPDIPRSPSQVITFQSSIHQTKREYQVLHCKHCILATTIATTTQPETTSQVPKTTTTGTGQETTTVIPTTTATTVTQTTALESMTTAVPTTTFTTGMPSTTSGNTSSCVFLK